MSRLYGTDAELAEKIKAFEAHATFASMKAKLDQVGGPALSQAEKKFREQYMENIAEMDRREAVINAGVASGIATSLGKRPAYSERPKMVGSELDWKRKDAKGSSYEDVSAKRAYTSADAAHKLAYDVDQRVDRLLTDHTLDPEEKEEILQDAAKLLKSGTSDFETLMREACLANSYSWAVVVELGKEDFATDVVAERFSEKRIKKAVKAVDDRAEKSKEKAVAATRAKNLQLGRGRGRGIPAPQLDNLAPIGGPLVNRYGGRATGPCFTCGSTDHTARNCPNRALGRGRGIG